MKREAGQGRQSGVSSQFRERAKGLLTTHVKTREPDVEVIAAESDALVGQTREREKREREEKRREKEGKKRREERRERREMPQIDTKAHDINTRKNITIITPHRQHGQAQSGK